MSKSRIARCNDCKDDSVFRINEYQEPFFHKGKRLRECIQCGRYEPTDEGEFGILEQEEDIKDTEEFLNHEINKGVVK